MNKIIINVATEYNTNPKALKRYVKESGIKPKYASKLQVLEVLFINAPSLLYCRADELENTVEYLDINLNMKLCQELKAVREKKFIGGAE